MIKSLREQNEDFVAQAKKAESIEDELNKVKIIAEKRKQTSDDLANEVRICFR